MKRIIVAILVALVVASFAGNLFGTSITLDRVEGEWAPDTIACRAVFYLRYTNDRDYPIGGIDNSFRIYTLGGGPFQIPIMDTLPWPAPDGGGWTSADHFSLIFGFYHGYGANDGVGADSVGFGGAKGTGIGLPIGFDYPVAKITVNSVTEYETLCIDSAWCPPTHAWVWAPGGGHPSEKPTWGGPYCFKSYAPPCTPPQYMNCPGEIVSGNPLGVSFQFNATGFFSQPFYTIVSGPGNIDSATGFWTFTPSPQQIGVPLTLNLGAWDCAPCLLGHCMTTVTVYMLGDINIDGSADIGDLIALSDHMFNGGEPPPVFELADANGDGTLDISDMIYLVDYMFADGPPPVNPWV